MSLGRTSSLAPVAPRPPMADEVHQRLRAWIIDAVREPGTRLIGSVAYFPEKYGAEILAVALDILNRRPVPPAVFAKHQLVTPENVDHIYPNDRLLGALA